MNISGISIQGGVRLSNGDPPVIITGGNVTYDNVYTVRTFTANSNLVITTTQVNTNPLLNVQYLLIAGGGGHDGSGGGAGGVLTGNAVLSLGTYPVIIGKKGNRSQNGGNSTFNSLTSVGGGAGNIGGNGLPGGSGGGGSAFLPGFPGPYVGGLGVPGQGFPGGGGTYGGGGGASEAGGNGTNIDGGKGGNGIQSNITGVLQYYAGGGNGLVSTGSAGLGQNNYGGGSQRVSTPSDTNAQPGVLIIRYPTEGTA